MKKALARGLEGRCPPKDALGLTTTLNCFWMKHKLLQVTARPCGI